MFYDAPDILCLSVFVLSNLYDQINAFLALLFSLLKLTNNASINERKY